MQEPLLFNMSIKDNILYGNDQASDQKVRHVASLANALQFIESNIEDLDKEEVKQKINQDFLANLEYLSKDYPNLEKLKTKFDKNEFRTEEVVLIKEILDHKEIKLMQLINEHIDSFINTLQEHSKKRGIRWDDIILIFEWNFEH